jgi:hypothetical protein
VRLPILALALIVSASAFANEGNSSPLTGLKGQSYDRARATLLSKGLKLEPSPANGDGCAPGREDVCLKYEETMSCLGTGLAVCRFVYHDAKGYYIVETTGEDLDVMRVRAARPATKSEVKNLTSD